MKKYLFIIIAFQFAISFVFCQTAEEYIDMALSYYNNGDYEKSIQFCDSAISINSKEAITWYYKGRALFKLKDIEEAIKCYDSATNIFIFPLGALYINVWFDKGIAFQELKKYDKAIICYDKLSESKRIHYEESLYNKARIYSLMKNKEEMIKSLKKATDADWSLKEKAKTEKDFEFYWNDVDFEELLLIKGWF